MFSLCLNTLALLLLQPLASSPRPLTTPSSGCPACEWSPLQGPASEEVNGMAQALGEPCGVYTLSCAAGLRCAAPEGDPQPIRTLLEGKGVCSNTSIVNSTENVQIADPVPTGNPDEAPCRKLLMTLIRGLDDHVFNKHHDIYMPNCDKRGFFRKKQCWSSRGKQRGKCWCVDENGMPVASHSSHSLHKGSSSC